MTDEERALTSVLGQMLSGGEGSAEALWRQLHEAGFTRLGVPEVSGGSGGPFQYVALLARSVGAHAAAVPAVESCLAGWLLAQAGVQVPDGVLTVGSGSLVVEAVSGGYRVTGTLDRVPHGRCADGVVALASGGVVVLVDPADTVVSPGVNLAGEPRDTLLVDVVLGSAAATPAGTREELTARLAALKASAIAGAADSAVTAMVRYCRERIQFGRPIGAFQAVQQQVAYAASESAAAGFAAEAGAAGVAAGRWWPAAAAQARAAQAAGAVAAVAHQVHGAIGTTREHSLHRTTTRLWAWREEGGSDRANAIALAHHVLAAGADGLWPLIVGADE